MAISFSCACGKKYSVDDSLAGKRTRCPACKAALVVPAPPPSEEEIVEVAHIEILEDEVVAADVVAADVVEAEVVEAEVVEAEPVQTAPAAAFRFAPEQSSPASKPPPLPKQKPAPVKIEADAEVEAEEDDESGPPKYFTVAFAADTTIFHNPKFFRVYRDGDALLFINGGPFNWSMIDALHAKDKIRGMAGRLSGAHGAEVGLGMGLLAGAAQAIFGALDAKHLRDRAAVLDPMTIEQLRAEVESDKSSFRVTPDDTTDVLFEAPKTDSMWADKDLESKIMGRLRFRHDPTGKWALLILTRADARAAIRAFRRVFGKDDIDVEIRIKRERG
jgi:hypothetical protein